MASISSLFTSSLYSYSAAVAGGNGLSVSKTSDARLLQAAVTLAGDASILSTINNRTSGDTYDAAGLLNSMVQAGTSATLSSQVNQSGYSLTAQQILNQGIAGSLSSSSSSSGIYNSSGVLQSLAQTNSSANWANVLKTNPGMASVAIADMMNQSLIGSLVSTTA
jgi:hypothetical protein